MSSWNSPNKVLYGTGSSKTVGQQLVKFGCKKVIVVYDKGIEAAGIVAKILGYIEEAGIEIVKYGDCLSDAPDYTINEAGALARKENVDGVVAVGGGSSLDTGKGVCILLSNEPPIQQYFAQPSKPPAGDITNLKPLILLPTTAGTGSEVTPGGAVADTEHNTKENFVCPISLGIIDPELTLGLPASVTATTGMDAFCHAFEAVTSNDPNPFSNLYGGKALSLVAKYLARACKDGSDLEAREGLHLAATMASMSILGPFCNIPHDTGAVICMDHNIPHGIAVSACLPEIIKFIAPACPEKLRIVAKAFGLEDVSDAEIGDKLSEAVLNLMNEVNMPPLSKFIKTKEDLLASVPKIMETQNFFFSSRPVTESDVTDILSKSWDLRN
ncbi:MAG: iron-containing alcohol dehydrogenase [Oscillospiraceae bacterium]|nr:iron-containing alcohol dehydrogenase [Oscillospiraceae bacterium]